MSDAKVAGSPVSIAGKEIPEMTRRWPVRATAVAACALAASLASEPARSSDLFTAAGTALEVALPLGAAACALRQHRLASYASGFLAQTAIAQGLKHGLGDAEINQRPNGQSNGFPSGHTAAAASGATDLAVHCAPGNRAVAIGAAAAVILVGASRMHAGEHDALQVVAGAALGASSVGLGVYETPGGTLGVSYTFPF
jgi:membrane-associated phospholipid phosphatase